MEEQKIYISNIATVTFCGKRNGDLDEMYHNAKVQAEKCRGEILREIPVDDGYFLEVLFPNEKDEAEWKNSIRLQ